MKRRKLRIAMVCGIACSLTASMFFWVWTIDEPGRFIFLPGGDVGLGFKSYSGWLEWIEYAPWDPAHVDTPILAIPWWLVCCSGLIAAFYCLGKPKRFSYVGACQVWMGLYIFLSRGLSRFVHSAWSLLLREQSEQSDVSFLLVLTSKAPRRAHSAIRAQEDLPPAHEISCASDDAHSVSRALDVESLAQNARRAIVPRRSLRGPAVQSLRGRPGTGNTGAGAGVR